MSDKDVEKWERELRRLRGLPKMMTKVKQEITVPKEYRVTVPWGFIVMFVCLGIAVVMGIWAGLR